MECQGFWIFSPLNAYNRYLCTIIDFFGLDEEDNGTHEEKG